MPTEKPNKPPIKKKGCNTFKLTEKDYEEIELMGQVFASMKDIAYVKFHTPGATLANQSTSTLKRRKKVDARLSELLERGQAHTRIRLQQEAVQIALDKSIPIKVRIIMIMFLLKTKCGYRETDRAVIEFNGNLVLDTKKIDGMNEEELENYVHNKVKGKRYGKQAA
jgi:hypothetical protein